MSSSQLENEQQQQEELTKPVEVTQEANASPDSAPDQLKELADEVDKAIIDISKKKKKKKGASEVQPTGEGSRAGDTADQASNTVDVKSMSDTQVMQYLQIKEYERMMERMARREMKGKDVEKEHKFWNTQPVLPLTGGDPVTEHGPIDTKTKLEDVRQEPFNMPAGFEWVSIDINDPAQATEVYTLLTENYVEDDECVFRFDYSIPFLQWALTPPGFRQDWHVGVRNVKSGALMGCITAVPVHLRVYDQVVAMAEINFLCVHKKLRTKRLAPVLIKEITRRVNLQDQWQAVYTAGIVLPKPVGRCRYFHRSLNPKKLIEVKFSSLPPKTTMAAHLKRLKLPAVPVNKGLRLMTAEDVPVVHKILNEYLDSHTKMAQVFSVEDVAHIFLPRDGVVKSYVIETPDLKIRDFCSFYYLPSSVLRHPEHNKLNAVYSYYNVAATLSLTDLMRDLLVLARNDGADVFNALDLMENRKTFDELKFGQGDGYLQYYLYNWKCPTMEPSDVGLVLL